MLFCDQVGSTDLLTRLGDDLAEEIRRDVFEALYRAADLCRGGVVKGSGDGLMVVFPVGSKDAVRCGELMVRMVARLARRTLWSGVQLKVGVSEGEAVFDKGDWYGAAVNLTPPLRGRPTEPSASHVRDHQGLHERQVRLGCVATDELERVPGSYRGPCSRCRRLRCAGLGGTCGTRSSGSRTVGGQGQHHSRNSRLHGAAPQSVSRRWFRSRENRAQGSAACWRNSRSGWQPNGSSRGGPERPE